MNPCPRRPFAWAVDRAGCSPGTHAAWSPFLAAALRTVSQALDLTRLQRDGELLETCLRVLGEVGNEGAEADAPADPLASGAVVALALDRSIACDWRADLVDRWSRSRALVAELEWGGLEPAALRAHLLAPERERPELLARAASHLDETPDARTAVDARGDWGRILDEARASDVQSAVRHLVWAKDVASTARTRAALERVATEEGIDRSRLDRLREEVEALASPADRGE